MKNTKMNRELMFGLMKNLGLAINAAEGLTDDDLAEAMRIKFIAYQEEYADMVNEKEFKKAMDKLYDSIGWN